MNAHPHKLTTYVLTEDDVFDGKNRLGMNVSHIPLNVPLCGGCDKPVDDLGWCSSCEEFQFGTVCVGDPLLRRRVAR